MWHRKTECRMKKKKILFSFSVTFAWGKKTELLGKPIVKALTSQLQSVII